jgi:hypothetical protein
MGWSNTSFCHGYYQTPQSFDFSFLIKMFASVFQKSDSLFNIFQKKMFGVSFCKQKINKFKKSDCIV